jgi:transcriptional regulator with XRE-family HTH domain
MTMRFRNLDLDTTQPMDSWPAEAIETVLDRGSLSDWRRLAHAIRSNPWGPAARTAETVAGWGEHYGADALITSVIRHAREDLTHRGRADYAAQIRSWRIQSSMTLHQFALAAGTSASRLSDYENAKVAPTTDVLGRLGHVADMHARRRQQRSRASHEDRTMSFLVRKRHSWKPRRNHANRRKEDDRDRDQHPHHPGGNGDRSR